MKLRPDEAAKLREALEPETHSATEASITELSLCSIAISLKRLADALGPLSDEDDVTPFFMMTKGEHDT